MLATLALAATLALTPTTPAWYPVIGPDGYTCPGGTLADGTVRPGDGFTPEGMTCVRIALAMIDAGG